jgi:hypothetical protein
MAKSEKNASAQFLTQILRWKRAIGATPPIKECTQKVGLRLTKSVFESSWAVIFVVISTALFGFFWGERCQMFGKLGDEVLYYLLAKDFTAVISAYGLSDYHIQRVLPSLVVYYLGKIFQIDPSVENVVTLFGIVHVVLMVVAGWVWCLVAKELNLSSKGRWLGVAALFLNFPILKYIPYIQVTTDFYAYAAGLLLVYFYLRQSLLGMVLVTLAGIFFWPTVIYAGIFLILFPRDKRVFSSSSPAPVFFPAMIAAVSVLLVFWTLPGILNDLAAKNFQPYRFFSSGATKPFMPLIYLSAVISMAWFFTVVYSFTNNRKFFDWRYVFSQFHWQRIVTAGSIFFASHWIIQSLARTKNYYPAHEFLKGIIVLSVIQPATFFVCHVLYFGPVLIFLFFLWKPFCRVVQEHGVGLVLCLLMTGLLSLHNESRLLMNFYPIAVPFLVKCLDELPWSWSEVAFIFILSFLFSKIWLPIHSPDWNSLFPGQLEQLYYMNFGPWMSHMMYAVQGMVVLFTVFAIWIRFHQALINQQNREVIQKQL